MKIVYKVPIARPVTSYDKGFVYVVAEEGNQRGLYDATRSACTRADQDTGTVQEMVDADGHTDVEIGEWAADGDAAATDLDPADFEFEKEGA